MARPYYADDLVTLHLGDCLDILAAMEECSVDAVVCDPPYGLAELSTALVLQAIAAWMAGDRTHVPDGRGFMGREWDGFVPPPGAWDECLRVLKPGGHLLAFAGTRTVDLMTLSIRIAGFEIRDGIEWIYGSGFPKSLDVSKAIDKAANAVPLWDDIRAHIRYWRDRAGMANAQLNAALGLATNGAGMARHWTSEVGGQHSIPSKAMWLRLKELLGWPDCELDAVYGEVKDGAERPVIARRRLADRRGDGTVIGLGHAGNADITAPGTESAAPWDGWGTALKPSHEPVIVARKPAGQGDILVEIGSRLDQLEIAWQVQAADPTTRTGRVAGSSAATGTSPSGWTAETCLNIVTSWRRCWADLCELTSTSTTGTTSRTTTDLRTLSSSLSRLTDASTQANSSPTDGQRSLVVAVDDLFAAALLSLRATLALSVIESATEDMLLSFPGEDAASPESSHEPIVVARKPLAGTVAQNVLAYGAGALNVDGCRVGTDDSLNGGAYAKNGSERHDGAENWRFKRLGAAGEYEQPAGRWPPNVLLSHLETCEPAGTRRVRNGMHGKGRGGFDYSGDGATYGGRGAEGFDASGGYGLETVESTEGCAEGCPVRQLDAQSGTLHSHGGGHRSGRRASGWAMAEQVDVVPPGDNGGASRFFPAFRYQAKAPKSERPRLADGTAWPTVKPLELMRWLVRLVTPPGGLVLDPFAGTGTTGEAARLEGFSSLLIERDPVAAKLALQRLRKPSRPTLFDVS